ncbi:MAG TPA: GTP-binding protein [Marinobacter sp.]|jgi:G3E family GTPase|nr:GTP-binding protein [Marinobacter sp.]
MSTAVSTPRFPIPTNLILGFLGVGKTTSILDLLRTKPDGEVWAVLVNEFGEVGIDGAILETEGAVVREVPGGCMCCVAGLPMQIALNQLIARAKPDRLLIEPTGLGHPSQILDTLTGQHYHSVLAMGPVITLVDPRRITDKRVLENVQFRDQVAAADIIVANKTDLCTDEQMGHFERWVAPLANGRPVHCTHHGRLRPEWLDGETNLPAVGNPHAHHHHHAAREVSEPPALDDEPWQQVRNRGQGHTSVGWRVHPELRFDESTLMALALDDRFARFKAVVNTREGWRILNVVEGALSVMPAEAQPLSRIELITEHVVDDAELDRQLRASAGIADGQ